VTGGSVESGAAAASTAIGWGLVAAAGRDRTDQEASGRSGCYDDAVPFSGEDNPNYRGGTPTTECEQCGDAFEYYPSEKEGLYCPDRVADGGWRDPPALDGSANPRWSGGPVELPATSAARRSSVTPGTSTARRRSVARSGAPSGSRRRSPAGGHPNWAGGGDREYGPGWAETRRAALERDDHTCLARGATRAELGRNPDVHHLVPVRAFAAADDRDVADAHAVANVVCPCPRCHRNAEFGTLPRERLRALRGE